MTNQISLLVSTYEADREAGRTSASATSNPALISWNRGLYSDLDRGRARHFHPVSLRASVYRPFTREHVYFDRTLNDMVYRLDDFFPTAEQANIGFYALNPGAEKPFSVLMLGLIPDLALYGSNAGQFFARWRYEEADLHDGLLKFDAENDGDAADGYRRIDNITDDALGEFRRASDLRK